MIPPGLVDPRGRLGREPLLPAPRPASLDGKRVLLIDNGKLDPKYGPYALLWEFLAERFPKTTWSHFSDDLLTYNEDDVQKLAEKLVAEKPDAAVLALADAGVSLGTALLAIALERAGIPTVIYATMLGVRFIRGIFKTLAPGLDPIALETVRTDTPEAVHEMAESSFEQLRAALTAAPKTSNGAQTSATRAIGGTANWPDVTDAMLAFQDWAEGIDLGDGLPLIPPSARAVGAMLESVADDPDAVILGPALTSGRMLCVRDAAANAVMTGCPPKAFPVVLAALRAMTHPAYILNFGSITTHPSGNAVVFSGPNPGAYGLTGGAGCLGPGHRGNASAGRAVQLTISSVFGARPGATDLTAFGSQAEFTYCFAEGVDASPWPSLADEIGGGKAGVLVMKAEGPRNIIEHLAKTPEMLCESIAATATGIGSNNAYVPGDLLVILNPEHARIFTDAGWTRTDLAEAIYALARLPKAKTEGHGVVPRRPAYMEALEEAPCCRSPRDVHIVVAGSAAPQSMVALPWGSSRAQWHPV